MKHWVHEGEPKGSLFLCLFVMFFAQTKLHINICVILTLYVVFLALCVQVLILCCCIHMPNPGQTMVLKGSKKGRFVIL